MSLNTGFCPQCKSIPVIKAKNYGPMPRCSSCLENNRLGRAERRKLKHGQRSFHFDASGNLYPNNAESSEQICAFCHGQFTLRTKRNGRPVCDNCTAKRGQERREKNLARVQATYWKDPKSAIRRRLSRELLRMGLSIEWFDSQGTRCGICGTDKPGGRGGWHIDHDHTCCQIGCQKCVRGILCHRCNVGLGQFCDEPERLKAAIQWLESRKRL